MSVDLRTCRHGDKLLSSLGETLTYMRLSESCTKDRFPHEVMYANGSFGTRTHDGFVFTKNRMPYYDHDIIAVNGKGGMTYCSEWFNKYLDGVEGTFNDWKRRDGMAVFENDANKYGLEHALKLFYTNAHHDGARSEGYVKAKDQA